MEAVEALSVLMMAFFLLPRTDEGAEYQLALPALGFLGMGILNSAHAAASPGDSFVFLRAIASLIGGLGFSLAWLPLRRQIALYRRWMPWTIAAGALTLSALAFLYPMTLPRMLREGTFSAVAVTLNVMAGTLFLAGTWHFALSLYRSGTTENLLFSLIGIFFGLSGLTFQYSILWSTEWWFWHVLRLIASLLVLGLLIRRHLQTVVDLETSLVERRREENALKRSYTLTKTIIDSMNDAISLIDVRNFTIVGVNSMFLKQYGYSDVSELVGKHCYEITHRRPDVCSPPDDICPLLETVRTKDHFSVDHVHYGRQGEKIYVEVSTSPIKDEGGNVIQVVHVQRNITDRKLTEQERERLLAELARSNTELEQFAYVASHDLQEPLRMVAGYVQLLEKKYKGALDETADKYIHFAADGAMRMQKLIEGLLAYSRVARRGQAFKPVDLNRVLGDALSNLAAVVREENTIITRADLPLITGDEIQLLQLFQNLIGNAIKFRNPNVRPEVHISSKKEQQEWTFSIRDNGIGIEKKYLDQIFQIFQRLHTAAEYPGAGIGLAVCKRIVERHGGRIWVESMPGEGSTFFFTIPSA
jgi:PAS domain S-box-containing protein